MISSEHHSASPTLLLNEHFCDMSLLGDAIDWDLDFRQIDAGELHAHAILIAGPRNMFMRVEFDRKFHQRGCPPPGILTFGFPDKKSGHLRWSGREAMPGALLNFNDGGLEGVNPGNFGGYTLSFAEDQLLQISRVLGIDVELSSTIKSIPFWNPLGPEHNHLRSILRTLERTAVINGDRGLQPLTETFNFEIAATVVRILASDHAMPPSDSARFRSGALKRALELINDPDLANMKVATLCNTVGASMSTLERAFLEEFGVTPKSYLYSNQLTTVRRQLLKAETGKSINEIANLAGFWHMGRFASDYRRKFGELPSRTLKSRE